MNKDENTSNEDWRGNVDDELFPVCNEDRVGMLHTDEYGITYVCILIPGLGYSWAPPEYVDDPPLERGSG